MRISSQSKLAPPFDWKVRIGTLLLAALLPAQLGLSAFALQTLPAPAQSQDNHIVSAQFDKMTPIRGQISLDGDLNISGDDTKVSLNMRNANLRDVLNIIAKTGDFNIILHDSVSGDFTVDIKDVPINKALEYIFTVMDLSYVKDGNTLIVASKETVDEKHMNSRTFKAIPVLYKSAQEVATLLNNTLFTSSRAGGSTKALAAANGENNTLLVVGTDKDIRLVSDALREIDVPRNKKIYKIKHSSAERVASILAQTLFTPQLNTQAGAAGAAAGAAGGQPQQQQQQATQAPGTGAAGGAGGNVQGIRTLQQGGVTLVSEEISSTLTVLGTDEQIAMVDAVIDQIDVRQPQAAIEVALVELRHRDTKTFDRSNTAAFNLGHLSLSLPDSGIGSFSISGNKVNGPLFSTGGTAFSISQSLLKSRAKVLANPTIVAVSGTQSEINITDDVVNFSCNTSQSIPPVVTCTQTTQQAGVIVSVTPTIFNDGSISLQITPTVSQPLEPILAPDGVTQATPLSTRTMTLNAVRLQDGETLVVAGLVRETDTNSFNDLPGIGKLPIIGALLRAGAANSRTKDRTELVLMVTPHILKDEGTSYQNLFGGSSGPANAQKFPNSGAFQPVSLPRFTGVAPDAVPTSANPATTTPDSNNNAKVQKLSRKGKTADAVTAAKESAPGEEAIMMIAQPDQSTEKSPERSTEKSGEQKPRPNNPSAAKEKIPIGEVLK